MAMACALVSCSTDELGSDGTRTSGKGGVQLVLSTDGFSQVSSRAGESVENLIRDVNILEYRGGTYVTTVYKSVTDGTDFSEAVDLDDLEALDATKMVEETDGDGNKVQVMDEGVNGNQNFIFVIANYGKKIGSEDGVHSLSALKTFTQSFKGTKDAGSLPMTGFYYDGINAKSTTRMDVTLHRAVAKINFKLITSEFKVGKVSTKVTVDSIGLCNVPANVTFYPCKVRPNLPNGATAGKWWGNEQTLFPTKTEMEATGGSVSYYSAENCSSDDNTYVAYIPENARGSYDDKITDDTEKHPSVFDSNVPDKKAEIETDKCYSYIRVVARYTASDGSVKRATYRIYLGGNSTGDMNVLRNTQYNVTTTLYGANEQDTRISVEDLGPAAEVITDNANCYMIDMSDVQSGSTKDIVIPLQQVNDGWDYITTLVSSQSSTAAAVKSMLESGNWEIQTEWKTWSGTSNVTGTKSSDFSASNLKATLTIPAGVTNGNNAVVKLVSKNDNKTYWSWHLWFTNYKPDETDASKRNGQIHQYISNAFKSGGTYYGKSMMDRNLGATIIRNDASAISQPSSTSEAIKYYGLMYQFGRKDPFVGSGDGGANFVAIYDANGKTLSSGSNIPFSKDTGGGNSKSLLATAVMNPSTFYTYNGNWTVEQNGLWFKTSDGKKTPFDPCPPGWRVPKGGTTATDNPWAGFRTGSSSATDNGSYSSWGGFDWSSSATGTGGRLYKSGGVQAWYPASGYLDYGDGALNGVGSLGFCWSASPNSQTDGYNLYFHSSFVNPSVSDYRAYGFPVRCVQERE